MKAPAVTELLAELADREAIRDCLYRYCRGVDRCDEEWLRSAYWEDAHDDHVIFSGTREALVAWVIPLLRAREATSHSLSNIIIRMHGERADVESYFQGYHVARDDGGSRAFLQGGRYLDRLERRGGEWRIAARKVVIDWFREFADAGDWAKGPQGHSHIKPGGRFPQDDSYGFLDLT